MMAY